MMNSILSKEIDSIGSVETGSIILEDIYVICLTNEYYIFADL